MGVASTKFHESTKTASNRSFGQTPMNIRLFVDSKSFGPKLSLSEDDFFLAGVNLSTLIPSITVGPDR
jgi:hypothetical protein